MLQRTIADTCDCQSMRPAKAEASCEHGSVLTGAWAMWWTLGWYENWTWPGIGFCPALRSSGDVGIPPG
ncbi:hypothetical protein I79_023762 [Cricetulus griseus]|uniref:Uncharacterized protein n=1 Tax=Cricetulus griseus TaxID=10029 RepID=G3IIT7_CRIGR|nr:hypothetical protein I79_023762 [Cricetulus griseus]